MDVFNITRHSENIPCIIHKTVLEMILFQHTRKSYFPQLFSAPTEQSTLTDTYLNQFIEI